MRASLAAEIPLGRQLSSNPIEGTQGRSHGLWEPFLSQSVSAYRRGWSVLGVLSLGSMRSGPNRNCRDLLGDVLVTTTPLAASVFRGVFRGACAGCLLGLLFESEGRGTKSIGAKLKPSRSQNRQARVGEVIVLFGRARPLRS